MSKRNIGSNLKSEKNTERPRIKINSSKKKIMDYIKQLITLISLQQVIAHNLEKEVKEK